MYTVTNRMNVKKGFARKMAPAFTKPGPLQEFEGFLKVEVAVCESFDEYDELSVVMYWETLDHFNVWRNSDAFKKAHERKGNGDGQESPLLNSQIIVAEVVSILDK